MLTDITLKITPEMIEHMQKKDQASSLGHFGTHFDIMDKEFPLTYCERPGLIFDVSKTTKSDITINDIDINQIKSEMFIGFYTGFIEKIEYGTKAYFTTHPQLSNDLIELLIEKEISLIGIDFAGVRRNNEHRIADQHCADNGVFIIENLCNLNNLCLKPLMINTYPMNFAKMTGLPCRVIAKSK